MSVAKSVNTRDSFAADVLQGLSAKSKRLASKYLYDARGSLLFEQICATPEYYLTRVELAIMQARAADIARALGPDVRLVEFGTGAGVKTRVLLSALVNPAAYVPVDISGSALTASCDELHRHFPALAIQPLAQDFTLPLCLPQAPPKTRRTALYLAGSTLGNFPEPESVFLLRQMRCAAGPDGRILLGLDLKKDPRVLHAAYNDAAGVTAAFTLNLLHRLNRELDANFTVAQFQHHARYSPSKGWIETDIVSRCAQRVHVAGRDFDFAAHEAIRVEVSCKYDAADIQRLAAAAGLRLQLIWTDAEKCFAVVLMAPLPPSGAPLWPCRA